MAAALVVVVLLFLGVYIASIASTFNDKRQTVDAGISTGQAADTGDGALNVLLLGSDSRGEGQDTAENKGEDGRRSDTMMLVHVPEDRQDVYVMSIVRDLWVTIPGHGVRKVNSALDLGGYPLVTQTMQELLGIQVDHLAVVDFQGFNGLTSALGGVQVCNPTTFSSGQVNPSYFPQGEILLQGADALRYVRERKAFLGGDFERVQNQQRFVSAVVDQVLTPETLANPQRVLDVVNALAPFVTVDEGLDAATIAGYGIGLNGIRSDDIHMFTIPHGPPSEGPGGASIVVQDPEGMESLRRALARDDLGSYLDGGAEAGSGEGAGPEEDAEAPTGEESGAGATAPSTATARQDSTSPESTAGGDGLPDGGTDDGTDGAEDGASPGQDGNAPDASAPDASAPEASATGPAESAAPAVCAGA